MSVAMKVAQPVIGIAGLALLGLGFSFWAGKALNFIPLHQQLGIFIVVVLWVLAIIGLFYGVNRARVATSVIWGFIVIGLGFMQTGMMVGSLHWVIRVVHLLVGIGALMQAAQLAKLISLRTAR
jgi:Na+-translocating ferredoxin:NAD+ oxidoreductase RnfE subunit